MIDRHPYIFHPSHRAPNGWIIPRRPRCKECGVWIQAGAVWCEDCAAQLARDLLNSGAFNRRRSIADLIENEEMQDAEIRWYGIAKLQRPSAPTPIEPPRPTCINCGANLQTTNTNVRCSTCAAYLRNHGIEGPVEIIRRKKAIAAARASARRKSFATPTFHEGDDHDACRRNSESAP